MKSLESYRPLDIKKKKDKYMGAGCSSVTEHMQSILKSWV
jgi:hypothetical protein